MIPRRASSVGDEPAGGDESADARARGRDRANFWGLVYINARIRSSVVDELALRPESQPKSGCHRRRYLRHEACGVGYRF